MGILRKADFSRRALSYSLEGLAPPDEVLFKSLVRSMNHLTDQKWDCLAPSGDFRVDLVVASEWCPPTVFQRVHPVKQPILLIGMGADRNLYLSCPVQPQRLIAELNRIGSLAVRSDVQHPQARIAAARAHAEKDGNQLFMLKQWPPSKYLVGVGRMRLATLLTGRAMTLLELQQRSGLQPPLCRAFISDLRKANLLVITEADASVVDAESALSEPHVALGFPSSAVAFAKPSALEKIRTRLGI